MDPETCLNDVENNLKNNLLDEAEEGLCDYRAWRRQGGFEPPNGDIKLNRLILLLMAKHGRELNEE